MNAALFSGNNLEQRITRSNQRLDFLADAHVCGEYQNYLCVRILFRAAHRDHELGRTMRLACPAFGVRSCRTGGTPVLHDGLLRAAEDWLMAGNRIESEEHMPITTLFLFSRASGLRISRVDRKRPIRSRIIVIVWLASAALGADEPKTPEKNIAAPGYNPLKENSVAAIAEMARPSLVTVAHSGRDGKEDGVGSGFVVSDDGLIATSLHVIGEARPISVRFANGKQYEATGIHAWDRKLDLAIIRIEASQLSALPLGDSDKLQQGASVVAMGNPLGLEHSVVQGVVSAKRSFDGTEMIQLAIPIEQGNSGGPLLDLHGKVHGILTMKSLISQNLGFAMPINALKLLLNKPNPVPINRWLTIGTLNPREWLPVMGARWRQRAGQIEVEGLGHGFGGRSLCLSQKPALQRPFEIAVSVRLDDEAGAAGLVFASDGDQKHYGFYPSAGQLRLTRFDGPNVFSWSILKQIESPHYRPGEWNRLRVRLEKNRLLCYVNEELVVESDDNELIGGKVGLAKFRDTKASFKNFQAGPDLSTARAAQPSKLTEALVKQIHNFSGNADPELLAALAREPIASQGLLTEQARKFEQQADHLRELAVTVHRQSVQTELRNVLDALEQTIDLFHAALLVAKFDNPELEVESYRRQLEEMAADITQQLPEKANDPQRLETLTKYLFIENGFHGSRSDYYNKANSYMSNVLDDREGLPITLSVLFMELARRIGVNNLTGIPLPGHFVVRFAPKDGEEQMIDVFEGAKPLSQKEAREKVFASTGGSLREEHLKPATKREIIVRMLRNLLGIARNREVESDVSGYVDLIISLTPDAARERLERAMLRLRKGNKSEAKEDLKWILEHSPEGLNLQRVEELYRSL